MTVLRNIVFIAIFAENKTTMAKILIMVRTSTEKQSIDDQHREMLDFCIAEGYEEKDMIWIEEQGASAAKVDDTYRGMIDRIKSEIENNPDIECFAVWHLNRLVRTEEVWVEIKSFFVARRIQVICKNPYLRLLAPDGSVDKGIELAVGLLVILAKQDQEERKAKFKRAKAGMLKKGQYVGGNTVKYGYKVEGKEFVEKEDEARVVRMIYDMYSTGNYSTYTLAKELGERGVKVDNRKVLRILSSTAYVGDEVTESGLHYPPIISRELYDKCVEMREKNMIDMKRGERIVLGAKLVKCFKCGAVCSSNSRHYVCCKHFRYGCPNGLALRQDVANDLLWRVAYNLHFDYLLNKNEDKMQEYKENLMIVEEKLKEAERKMEEFTAKKGRIMDSYIEGLISQKDRDIRLLKVKDDILYHQGLITALNDRKRAIMSLLETDEKDTFGAFEKTLENIGLEDKFSVIHRHIENLVARPVSYGIRDPRSKKNNAVEIEVKSIYGTVYKYMYFPRYYKGHNLYVFNGKEWVGDRVTPISHTSK